MQGVGTSPNAAQHTETLLLKPVFSGWKGEDTSRMEFCSVEGKEGLFVIDIFVTHQCCTGIKKTAHD